jgi:hypothetical protein
MISLRSPRPGTRPNPRPRHPSGRRPGQQASSSLVGCPTKDVQLRPFRRSLPPRDVLFIAFLTTRSVRQPVAADRTSPRFGPRTFEPVPSADAGHLGSRASGVTAGRIGPRFTTFSGPPENGRDERSGQATSLAGRTLVGALGLPLPIRRRLSELLNADDGQRSFGSTKRSALTMLLVFGLYASPFLSLRDARVMHTRSRVQ